MNRIFEPSCRARSCVGGRYNIAAIPPGPTHRGAWAMVPAMAHHRGKGTRPSGITVPAVAAPLCRLVFSEMKRIRRTYEEMEHESGVLRGTIKQWRKPHLRPRFPSLEAALVTLGWDFAALPFADSLPAGLRRDLEGAIERHAADFPALDLLAEIHTDAR